jgi:16S rRNA (guanine527-N7)-methyltransferase
VLPFQDQLRRILRGYSLPELSEDVLSRMAVLDRLVVEWSKRLDLVGFRTNEERVVRYFVEPLAALPHLPGRVVEALDIGSGGGTPALPLALLTPQSRWTLLEPRRKKARFLAEAVRVLGLPGVRVSTERFRGTLPRGSWDLVTSRGVRLGESEVEGILEGLQPSGRFLWFSGEARLAAGAETLAKRGGADVRGPLRILGAASQASLLVVGSAEGECFT